MQVNADNVSDKNDLMLNAWHSKPELKVVYSDYFRLINDHLRDGKTLEIGSGSVSFRDFRSDVISCDIVRSPKADFVANAEDLPITDNALDNVVAIDVLHHLANLGNLFEGAGRALAPGGRMVFLEPGITPLSYGYYKFLHHEPLMFNCDPYAQLASPQDHHPFDTANQAVPTKIFVYGQKNFIERYPELTIKKISWEYPFSFPMSGGFKPWSLLNPRGLEKLLSLESKMPQKIKRLIASRLLIVIEKKT